MQQSFSSPDSFVSISGLRINYDKTEALWIGAQLLTSQLVYIMPPLPSSSEHLKEINNFLSQLLWEGKRDEIRRAEMINDDTTGGLKTLDDQSFNRALKAKWIQK